MNLKHNLPQYDARKNWRQLYSDALTKEQAERIRNTASVTYSWFQSERPGLEKVCRENPTHFLVQGVLEGRNGIEVWKVRES